MSNGGSGGSGGGNGPAPRKLIKDITTENLGGNGKPEFFSVRGTVTFFRGWEDPEHKWQYPSNPETKKKVTLQGDQWWDESANKSIETCLRRYVLSLACADHTGTNWFTAFDDQAAMILKKSADDLYMLSESDPPAARSVWKSAMLKPYVLRVRAKAETYNDEQRVKYSLVGVEPLSFRNEGQTLLEQIRKYVG